MIDKIKLSRLSIELTRRCNFKCSHCFKGDAQNVDISNTYIDKLLGMIEEIYTLHITGGEPSLNLEGMQHLIDVIEKNKIVIHRLNIICNGGTEETIRFFDMLDELNKMVLLPEDTRITISCDPYHSISGKVSIVNLLDGYVTVNKLNERGYSFKVFPYFTCCYPPIVAMGRGENSKFVDPENPDKYGILYNHPVNIHDNVIKNICIHANGVIARDLNISYEKANDKKYQICHIDDITNGYELIEAAKKWNQTKDVRIRGTLFDIASRIYSPVCKECKNYSLVYNQRLQLLKQVANSEETKEYPEKFSKSNFLKKIQNRTENTTIPNDSVTLCDAMNCQWWDYTCWKR